MSRSWSIPRRLVLLLVVSLALTGVWATSTSDPALSAYNPGWDGGSALRERAGAGDASTLVGESMSAYDEAPPAETVAFVLSPDRRYTDAEVSRLRQFGKAGGTLVIAEDFGSHTNPLLSRLNVSTRVDGRLLRDERNYYRSPDIVVATGVADADLTDGVDRLTLNRGTVLQPNGARVLVETSAFAYVDANGNASLDPTDPMRRHPVVTVERLGAGRAVVIADSSLFINAMLERNGNRRFMRSLVSGHDVVLLDYSHAEPIPPLVQVVLELRRRPLLQGAAALVGVALLTLLGLRLPSIRTRR